MANKSSASNDFRRKIKTREEIKALIGERPRKKSVVMCHGTFDIVHPGHLRHLMYAKERADILIASLTCDAHIHKANLRPFVPQELRAVNLAAIEVVDYVVVDPNDTPLENIKFLQPDFFAKGFDYFEGGIPAKTKEEIAALDTFGGEILFTPGDVVYSSSALIESAAPKLGAAKLLVLMQSENITFDDLRAAVQKFKGLKVHVVGDTIVDSYTYCRTAGGVTKTPTISVQFERQTDFAGGAAVVAKHMRGTGADVTFSTVLGDDELKNFVLEDLKESGVECRPYIDKTRPTTQKNSFIVQGYHLLRMGKLDNRIISDKAISHLSESLENTPVDAVVFSDYRHGIFSRHTIERLVKSIPANTFKVADSQVASRWGNILEFQNFDLLTPNEREARFALGDQDSTIRPLARELYNRAHCKTLMLTLGERGLMTYRGSEFDLRSFFTVDSFAQHVVDAVGSGDALLSYATLSMIATNSDVIASILGTMAAALACERDGNNPIKPEDVLKKIEEVEKAVNYTSS